MHRGRAGYTLLEIVLAVAIGLLVLSIAVPSIRGALEEQKLQQAMTTFDDLVGRAHLRSINERRPVALVWKDDAIEMWPLERREGDPSGALETMPLGREQHYALARPAALVEKAPPVWTFWRSGTCEPVVVAYEGPEGTWKARYDGLTTRRTLLESAPR